VSKGGGHTIDAQPEEILNLCLLFPADALSNRRGRPQNGANLQAN